VKTRYGAELLAEVYLDRDLEATATSHAHLHDSACGDLRAGDSSVHRLPLRPPCRIAAIVLEKTNQPGEAGQARDGPGCVGDRTPYPTQLSASIRRATSAQRAASRLAARQQARAMVRLTMGLIIGVETFDLAALTRSGEALRSFLS